MDGGALAADKRQVALDARTSVSCCSGWARRSITPLLLPQHQPKVMTMLSDTTLRNFRNFMTTMRLTGQQPEPLTDPSCLRDSDCAKNPFISSQSDYWAKRGKISCCRLC
jgi:hypothetical protein